MSLEAKKSDILCRPGKFEIKDTDLDKHPDTVLKIFAHVLITQAEHNLMRRGTKYEGYSLLFNKILEDEGVVCRGIPEYKFTITAETFKLVVENAAGEVVRKIRF